MSLITEALKRTRDASQQSVPAVVVAPPPVPAPAVKPVPRRTHTALWAILGITVLAGGVGGYFALRTHAPVVVAAPREEQLVARVVEKIKAEQPAPTPPPPVAVPAPAPVPVAVPEPVVARPSRELPMLKLQGISRDVTGYEAMINNQSIRIGDEIEGARVSTIETGVVKLMFDNKEIVLRLR